MRKRNIAIIFAGGVGIRMNNTDLPKQFLTLRGKPVIIHTLEHFERHQSITDIIVVCLDGWQEKLTLMLQEYNISKVKTIVTGGKNTQESIYHGLCEAEKLVLEEDAVVLIHDGVRPLINEQTITDNIESVRKYGTCITCAPPTETIVMKSETGVDIPRRKDLLVARAPQSFYLSDILAAHRKAIADVNTDFIDCCEMMHHYGHSLNMVMGPSENLKITTQADFYMCEALMKMKQNENGE